VIRGEPIYYQKFKGAYALLGVSVFLDFIGAFFNDHVVKLFRVKDFTTFKALDKLRVLVPGDDSYPGMFAGRCHGDRIQWKYDALSADCSGLSSKFKGQNALEA
jgi:hypothetical protein